MQHYRVYVRGPDDLHYLIVEADEPIDAADRLNGAASSTNPFVELGGQTFRADEVVAVVEEVDRSDL
jgi:hypothetical protein